MDAGRESVAEAARGRRHLAVGAIGLALALSLALALAADAPAARPYAVNFADNDFYDTADDKRRLAFDRAAELDSSFARIAAGWRAMSPTRPDALADPEDSAYRWGQLDKAVEDATDRGLTPLITFVNAPEWAQAEGGPPEARGSFKPNPQALGGFARALVTRYDGTHVDPDRSPEPLPRVDHFEVFNEVNLASSLIPQWGGKRKLTPKSPDIYRRLLNSFYDNAHELRPEVKVLATGMSPFGDPPGGRSLAPLRFFRELLCLEGRRALKPVRGCPEARFDILSDHPISPSTGPRVSAAAADDVSIADLGKVRKVLRTAERKATVASGRHPLWVTEYWWETNPPADNSPTIPSPSLQARWIAEAQYLLWRKKIANSFLFQLADDPIPEEEPLRSWQTGLYFKNGEAKPSLKAAKFPLVAERRSRRKVYVWTRPPRSGRFVIERRRKRGWREIASGSATAGIPFGRRIKMRAKGELRAAVAGEKSYVWNVRGRNR